MNCPSPKFSDRFLTAEGKERAWVPFGDLKTLWFNTGSLCNLTCQNCYMESSPVNDVLVYLTAAEVASYLEKAQETQPELHKIGFTGGEPFLNPEMMALLRAALDRGFEVLVLTNAMKPMRRRESPLLELLAEFGDKLVMRVSLDHYSEKVHDGERGAGGFAATLEGMRWLSEKGFRLHCAGRSLLKEDAALARKSYGELFTREGIRLESDPGALVIFPEMDLDSLQVPEITTGCWNILGKEPASVMCADSRMVLKRRGAVSPSVARCTLLPYDKAFDSGPELSDSFEKTHLNHVYCAQFCVLGGASCSQ